MSMISRMYMEVTKKRGLHISKIKMLQVSTPVLHVLRNTGIQCHAQVNQPHQQSYCI